MEEEKIEIQPEEITQPPVEEITQPTETLLKPKVKRKMTEKQLENLAKGRLKASERRNKDKIKKMTINEEPQEYLPKPEVKEVKVIPSVKKKTKLQLKREELERLKQEQEEDDIENEIQLFKSKKKPERKIEPKVEIVEEEIKPAPRMKIAGKSRRKNF
jgi:hypothetical protein